VLLSVKSKRLTEILENWKEHFSS